jgi:hypothetical protein
VHAVSNPSALCSTPERGDVVTVADKVELRRREPLSKQCECIEKMIGAFVAFDPSEVGDHRLGGFFPDLHGECAMLDAVIDHFDMLWRKATLDELPPCTFRNDGEELAAIHKRHKLLSAIDVCTTQWINFPKNRAPEKVMTDAQQRLPNVERRPEWNFVEIINDDIRTDPPAEAPILTRNNEVEQRAASPPHNFDAIAEHLFRCRARKAATEQHNTMPSTNNAGENLVEVCFCSPGKGICTILPIDDKDGH